ncbi:flagellar basal body-associated FliL family protein [Halorhodospira halochloris]|uniref:flagellar basal body-associated FliL family protein n=1 Tax=Halorhodospira halochloris TaxID=1052 RepID=UPI001EE81FE6|nr:flagellar basal body-associated FliL family protein [Halorhodospira halochloris]
MPKIIYIFMLAITLLLAGTMGLVGAMALGYITPAGIQENGEPDLGDPIYLRLEPPLTVNFERGQRISYLQAEVELMARSDEALEAVERHMPVVRNNLLMLFADQSFQELNTRAGREELRRKSLDEINGILEERGAQGEVEAVYFTSFVMQ